MRSKKSRHNVIYAHWMAGKLAPHYAASTRLPGRICCAAFGQSKSDSYGKYMD